MLSRNHGTTRHGQSFSLPTIHHVWAKAQLPHGTNAFSEFRLDACGAYIRFSDYGNTASEFGWEIDHMFPVAKGGSDELANLQPLNWRNNRTKADNWPHWVCAVRAAA